LFLLELAAGICLLLPLVGRRNAGPKFYRLILLVSIGLVFCAAISHLLAGSRVAAALDAAAIAAMTAVILVLRYPRRLVYRITGAILAAALMASTLYAYQMAVRPAHPVLTVAGMLSSAAILGSVMLAMLLGHWYLVVRGMPIEPLKRLTKALLVATILKIVVVAGVLVSISSAGFDYGTPLHRVLVGQGIFFWMRIGWGLIGPLALYPMIWGTVKIRSTMAATGILYVAVVAVIIGEVLGTWLSALERLPL
jgi:hypothetical protein